jgi:F-type H+-transporting ATPase subunit b
MESFDQIFTVIAENKGISLNTDILETGLLNIAALVGILIYTGKDFLGSLLEERKTIIIKSVQDAEDRLNEAQTRLIEAEKQLNQAYVIISEIKNETVSTKVVLLQADASEARKELKIRFERALASFRSKEREIFLEIKEQIIMLVFRTALMRANIVLRPRKTSSIFISQTILKVRGDLR